MRRAGWHERDAYGATVQDNTRGSSNVLRFRDPMVGMDRDPEKEK